MAPPRTITVLAVALLCAGGVAASCRSIASAPIEPVPEAPAIASDPSSGNWCDAPLLARTFEVDLDELGTADYSPFPDYQPTPEALEPLLGIAHLLRTSPGPDVVMGTPLGVLAETLSEGGLVLIETSERVRDQGTEAGFNTAAHLLDLLGMLTCLHHRFLVLDDRVLLLDASEMYETVRELDRSPNARLRAEAHERARIHWRAPEEVENEWFGTRFLSLSGRLGYAVTESETVPLTWKQAVRVFVAREPGIPSEGAAPIPPRDERSLGRTWSTVETWPDGSFAVYLALEDIRRVPGEAPKYQVGLSLPDLEPGGCGRGAGSPLPQSVAMLSIPGPALLSPELELVNAVSSPTDRHFDPWALVRAVNGLRALGKERALALLHEYLDLVAEHPRWDEWRRDPRNLDTGDPASVFLIVLLLFQPRDEDGSHPLFSSGMVAREPAGFPGDLYPLVLVDDIPFLVPERLHGRSGHDSDPRDHLAWASADGVLRERPLRPSSDPVGAFEKLMSMRGLPDDRGLCAQLCRLLEPTVDTPLQPVARHVGAFLDAGGGVGFPGRWGPVENVAGSWAEFIDRVRALDLTWDEAQLRYVSR